MEECFHRSRRQLTQWFTQSSEKIYRTLCTEKNYKRRERSGRATAVCYRTIPKVNAAFWKKRNSKCEKYLFLRYEPSEGKSHLNTYKSARNKKLIHMVKRASQKTACKLLNNLFNNSCLHHKFLFSNAENYGKQQKTRFKALRPQ